MLFNSISFAIFLPIVFVIYWFITNRKLSHQNLLLLISSYFFYACWDYRFLFLLFFSTFLDYFTGIKIFNSKSIKQRRFWFWLSIIVNLGFLCIFKYYNFFVESFVTILLHSGSQVNIQTLNVILPVGISFYTFHGLSYVIDIYYKRIVPVRKFVDYSVFVSFFPLLVAGPIERSTHLLPQIQSKRTFNYLQAVDGLKQILWGLFKKIVIADNCAQFANIIFNDSDKFNGSTLVLGAIFFSIQIYCDFSGYSDIALGTARLFGIELLKNFSFPYFSRNIAEFWRRWHISLSSWFRDYLYIPLGGSRGGMWMKIRNTFIIFLVSGFWHGANWTFIIWGAIHAIYFLPSLLLNKNRNYLDTVASGRYFPSFKELCMMGSTYCLTTFAWIFFRARDIHHAINYIDKIFTFSFFKNPYFPGIGLAVPVVILSVLFVIIEWLGRENNYAIEDFASNKSQFIRWSFYIIITFILLTFQGGEQQFIYFNF